MENVSDNAVTMPEKATGKKNSVSQQLVQPDSAVHNHAVEVFPAPAPAPTYMPVVLPSAPTTSLKGDPSGTNVLDSASGLSEADPDEVIIPSHACTSVFTTTPINRMQVV